MPDAATIPVPNTAGDLQSWINLFTSTFGATGNSNSESTSPEGLQAAMGALPLILQMITSQDYSPEAADKDSGPAVQLILQHALENGIPGISGAEGSAGAYDSTTSALMKNDLSARAGAEGAALIAKNKATYGALRNGQTNSLIALINSIINANRRVTSSATTPNLASNPAARRAALGALAAGAARNAMKPKPPGGIPQKPQPQPLEQVSIDDLPPEQLMNIQNPESLPNFESMDDLPESGPTPSVSVENTGNLDTSGDLIDNGSGPSGLDGFDLMSLGDLGADIAPGGGDESLGLDFGNIDSGDNTIDDGSDSNWDFLGDTDFGGGFSGGGKDDETP